MSAHHAEYVKGFALKPVEASPIFQDLNSTGKALKAFFAQLNNALAQLEQSQPKIGLPKRDGYTLPSLPQAAAPETAAP